MKSLSVMQSMVTAPPLRNSAEWASSERVMPSSSPIPGKFDALRNPYIIPIAEAVADFRFNKITAVMGTQMGKSVGLENIVGWRLDDDPTPILYVAPTTSMIDNTIEPRFMDMFRQCESLNRKFNWTGSTKYTKWLSGVKFRFAWAGSPTELAGDSAGFILVDEVDRIVNTSEGDTTAIIEARGDAYVDSKVLYTATPTSGKVERIEHPDTGLMVWGVQGDNKLLGSKVWQLWQSGTRHEWQVPCPDCDGYFSPSSHLIWWQGKGGDDLVEPTVAAKTARLNCPHCGSQLKDKFRQGMNKLGKPVAPGEVCQNGIVTGTADTDGNNHYSLWVSGLFSFSAKKSLGYCAQRLCAAENSGDPATLQGVLNTVFGECYAGSGEVPEWQAVRAMAHKYHIGELLHPPALLLGTVDVQKNRLVWVIRAWYEGMGSALVDCGELWGDTLQDDVWDELSELLEQTFDGVAIDDFGIDCGYRDDKVFDFVRDHKGKARALRGGSLDKPYRAVRVDVNERGKTRKRGDTRWDFDSSRAKAWVHSRIGWDKKRPAWWVLPADISESYCKEITGEEFDEASQEWNRLGENHFLDCEAMQYMLAKMKGLHRKKQIIMLDGFTAKVTAPVTTQKETPPKPQPAAAAPQQPDNWLGQYTDDWI